MTSAVGAEYFSRIMLAKVQVTRSAGAESMPIWGIRIAPVALAVLSYFVIMLPTQAASPVTSR